MSLSFNSDFVNTFKRMKDKEFRNFYAVVMLMKLVCVYILATICSSNVFLNPFRTNWHEGWTWFWLVLWFSSFHFTWNWKGYQGET